MAAAVFAFVLMMLWYGVVPAPVAHLRRHEWGWRADRLFFGPVDLLRAAAVRALHDHLRRCSRDLVVPSIYGVGLAPARRSSGCTGRTGRKTKAVVVPTTAYGRPLARKG